MKKHTTIYITGALVKSLESDKEFLSSCIIPELTLYLYCIRNTSQ